MVRISVNDMMVSLLVVLIVCSVTLIIAGVRQLKKNNRKETAEPTEPEESAKGIKLDVESPSVRYSNNLSDMDMNERIVYAYTENKVLWKCDNCETENPLTEDMCCVCGYKRQ